MTPYYQQGGITIYCGDCREILPGLKGIDSLVTDPPYGLNLKLNYGKRYGAYPMGDVSSLPVYGDDEPFDPTYLLKYQSIILWGAENYADKLPINQKWLIWDKRTDLIPSRSQGDGEMAWTNLEGTNRIFRHIWDGMIKDSERGIPRQHPTQKPVALMMWCIQQIKTPGLICDPYIGSGTTLVAAKNLGYPAIGIEISEAYCEIAVRRLQQVSMFESLPLAEVSEPEQLELLPNV